MKYRTRILEIGNDVWLVVEIMVNNKVYPAGEIQVVRNGENLLID